MAQPAKAQEPTMEEILASIRRIIADDDATKPVGTEPPAKAAAAKPSPPPPAPRPPPPAAEPADAAGMSQDDIDAMLAGVETAAADVTPDSDATPDVLELTEAMAAPTAEAPAFHRIESSSDIVFAEEPAPPRPAPPPRQSLTTRPAAPRPEPAAILSERTTAAVDAAFNSLAHTVLVQNAKTLEDLVKEMLRPMLKSWLDDNLPTLVERLVRAEIERVSRGR